jgi:hypothetical protein
MLPEKAQQIQPYTEAIAALLYEETDPEQIKTLESIEITVREHVLEHVSPAIALFLSARGPEKPEAAADISKAMSEN